MLVCRLGFVSSSGFCVLFETSFTSFLGFFVINICLPSYFPEIENMQSLPKGGLGEIWQVSGKGTILVSNWT